MFKMRPSEHVVYTMSLKGAFNREVRGALGSVRTLGARSADSCLAV